MEPRQQIDLLVSKLNSSPRALLFKRRQTFNLSKALKLRLWMSESTPHRHFMALGRGIGLALLPIVCLWQTQTHTEAHTIFRAEFMSYVLELICFVFHPPYISLSLALSLTHTDWVGAGEKCSVIICIWQRHEAVYILP